MIIIFAHFASAETMVLRGNWLDDVTRTPSLGAGFSLATMDFKYVCYKDVKVALPSYDVEYSFRLIDERFKNELRLKNSFESKRALWFIEDNELSQSSQSEYKEIFAQINLKSYYASLDESSSLLADDVKKLLDKKNYVGFFDSCGSYYIKTITRHSAIFAVLKFKSDKDDKQFSEKLIQRIRSIGWKLDEELEYKKRELNIRLIGYGLSKEHVTNLSPTSIEAFHQVIENAMSSMSGVSTGRVVAIEVIPWTANLNFRSLLELSGMTLGSFKTKRIVMENSEFESMVKSRYLKLQEYYHLAMNCQMRLEDIFNRKMWRNNKYELMYNIFDLKIKDHTNKHNISANVLHQALVNLTGRNGLRNADDSLIHTVPQFPDRTLERKWDKYTLLADDCLEALNKNFDRLLYRSPELSECAPLMAEATTGLMPDILARYCSPVITKN